MFINATRDALVSCWLRCVSHTTDMLFIGGYGDAHLWYIGEYLGAL